MHTFEVDGIEYVYPYGYVQPMFELKADVVDDFWSAQGEAWTYVHEDAL